MVFIVIKDNNTMPREKALNYGISSLNDNELLALIIKSAFKDKNVLDLSKDIIEKANGFENLYSLSYEELISIKGIKEAKALEILAILEISKRLSNISHIDLKRIENDKDLIKWCRNHIAYSDQEEFFAIFLNNDGRVLKYEILFKGSNKKSIVGITEILRKALLYKACYMIVAHNHPGGNPNPSKEDIDITNSISKSLETIGIKLIDHIIITKSSYFSFNSHNLL